MYVHKPKVMECILILFAAFISFASILFSCFLWYYRSNKPNAIPTCWPVMGMTPTLFSNLHRGMQWLTEVLQHTGGTFLFKGPWLCNMELLFTADPANVHYIMSKRHDSFHKGDDFNEIFDILGDGIFNSDSDKWKYQRKVALSVFSSTRFREFDAHVTKDKIHNGLIPFLERAHSQGLVFDLQHVFQSLSADISYMVLIGHDFNALSFDPATNSLMEAIHRGEEAVILRHILPEAVWRLQRRFGIGKEGALSLLEKRIDSFVYETIRRKREEVNESRGSDLISLYIQEKFDDATRMGFRSPDVFLRDTFFSFLLAGNDTLTTSLTWLFWLLIKHPKVEARIREELRGHNSDISQVGDASSKLVYLHAAVLESLRLYPPVPFNHRTAKQAETLPSGHQVKTWTKIILVPYSMGRMRSVWGADAEEFRPERWITKEGAIKHEPSHKFFAFNSGPRICIGKEMSMMRMKAAVCSVLRHSYRFEVVEGHRIEPTLSVVFQMKHGLPVRVHKLDK